MKNQDECGECHRREKAASSLADTLVAFAAMVIEADDPQKMAEIQSKALLIVAAAASAKQEDLER